MGKEKVYVFFQPHTFSRTKSLKKDFCKAFDDVESLFICTTYRAREDLDRENNEQALAHEISKSLNKPVNYGGVNRMIKEIKKIKSGGIMLFLGAGDMQSKIKSKLFESK